MLFLDFSMLHYITVLHFLIYQASVLSAVYTTLKAQYIFFLLVILLSSPSVAQVNVPCVCFCCCCYIQAAYKLFCLIATGCDHYRNTRINKCSLKVVVCHLDLGTKASRDYHLI